MMKVNSSLQVCKRAFVQQKQTFVRTSLAINSSEKCRVKSTVAAVPIEETEAAKPFSEIPGPKPWPFLKNMPEIYSRRNKDLDAMTAATRELYETYGDIFKFELPHRSAVIIANPHDSVKVLQNEGRYPYGSASDVWPFLKFIRERNNDESIKYNLQYGISSTGEVWREARNKLAPHIVPPKAAKDYLPAIALAANYASQAADQWGDKFDSFVNRVAFDMFAALSLGEFTRTASPQHTTDILEEFVEQTLSMFTKGGQLLMDPFAKVKPWKYKEFANASERSLRIAEQITGKVIKAISSGEGSEYHKNSYIAKLLSEGYEERAISSGVMAVLQAGVDTTGYVTDWVIVNLASNPDKQQRLREELQTVLQGRDLSTDDLDKVPYLKACIRESHRLTPPFGQVVSKRIRVPLVLNGYLIPENTMVALNLVGKPWDEDIVDNPRAFVPERFLPDAVAARKGTPKEIIDHRLFAEPFSGGARMCLGARVANLEILAITARLVQDWKIEVKPNQTWKHKQFLMLKADPFPKLSITRAN